MPVTVPEENLKPVERHTVRRVVDTFRPYKRKVSIVAGQVLIGEIEILGHLYGQISIPDA